MQKAANSLPVSFRIFLQNAMHLTIGHYWIAWTDIWAKEGIYKGF